MGWPAPVTAVLFSPIVVSEADQRIGYAARSASASAAR
jgi:hypothetical protein